MDYIPVYEGEEADGSTVKVSLGKLQRTGVKTASAERAVIARRVRAPGMMLFTSGETPFQIDRLEVARLSQCWGLMPEVPSQSMHLLAARVLQALDRFRAPLSEDDIERADPDRLTAPQFTNLHRWGDPHDDVCKG